MTAVRALLVLSFLAFLPVRLVAAEPDAAALVEQGHYKRARPLVEKRLAVQPGDAPALVLKAQIKLAYLDTDAAVKTASQAIAADRRLADARVVMADALGRGVDAAGMLEKLRIARRIKAELDTALASNPGHVRALEAMLSFSLQAPGVAGGSTARARECAGRIAAVDRPAGEMALARIAEHDKKGDQVLAHCEAALAADPRSYDATMRLAGLHLSEAWKDTARAERYAEAALRIDPSREPAHATLAALHAAAGRWAALDRVLADAEAEVPDNLGACYAAARTLLMAGRELPRAEGLFRRYLGQREPEGNTPSLAAAHWRLGQVLEKLGRRPEALREVQTAIDLGGLPRRNLEEAKKDLKRLRG